MTTTEAADNDPSERRPPSEGLHCATREKLSSNDLFVAESSKGPIKHASHRAMACQQKPPAHARDASALNVRELNSQRRDGEDQGSYWQKLLTTCCIAPVSILHLA